MNRSTVPAGSFRRSVAALGVMSLIAFSAVLILAGPAVATPFTGGLSPTVIDGLFDLNGDNEVTGADDSNAFYGDTAIIDGGLDCDAWSGPNGGEAGDEVIDANDDCQMIAYDGTVDGVTIEVVDGSVDRPDGSFPEVFNASDPDNPDVGDSDFAWSTIGGLVDANGDETIDANDCSFDVVGSADILGNTVGNTNPCGFANPPAAADNGKVDLNSNGEITVADTCADGCFLGHNVTLGVVQEEGVTPPNPTDAFSGTFGPTIVSGRADLNGDGAVTGRDDSNAFFGDTSIIDGQLDCNNWSSDNDGTGGDLAITNADDCTLIGFDGTADGITINVVDGEFQFPNGALPTVFNATDPDNADVGDSDFAWSAIGGRVDSSGNEIINSGDCHFGLIGETVDAGLNDATDGADILANDLAETNPCGFGVAGGPDPAFNGLVDLNSDLTITAADSCEDCFFGLDLDDGFVVVLGPDTCPGFAGDPRTQVVGTSGDDVLVGTAGADIICGLGGSDTLSGLDGSDLLLGGGGPDLLRGSRGLDTLKGGAGADRLLAHSGSDLLIGDGGADVLRGGDGPDALRGKLGNDSLFGERGNDRLLGGPGRDALDGGAGNNDLGVGGPGADTFVRCERQRP
jgi:Ca2+-binding RTX toxin-like protein